jgi:hypothetical protein
MKALKTALNKIGYKLLRILEKLIVDPEMRGQRFEGLRATAGGGLEQDVKYIYASNSYKQAQLQSTKVLTRDRHASTALSCQQNNTHDPTTAYAFIYIPLDLLISAGWKIEGGRYLDIRSLDSISITLTYEQSGAPTHFHPVTLKTGFRSPQH